jgi:hypothetical protein
VPTYIDCMNDVLITIAISIITNGTLLGLFIWVFKRLFDSALTKRAEIFKQEIELINKKNFYQFSKLYDEQANVIKEVYAELVDLLSKANYLVYQYNLIEKHPELYEHYLIPKDGDPIKWEWYYKSLLKRHKEGIKAQEISEQTSKDQGEFRKKRIYFQNDIADEIERLFYLIFLISHFFEDVSYRDPYKFEPMVAKEVIETWGKAAKMAGELFPLLEESFRKHIGINKPQ